MDEILFNDRREAGQALGAELVRRGIECSAVLGLIRGGAPVAFEVASIMRVPMDVLVVKKLRSPMSAELAIGAICADGTRVLREDVIGELEVTQEYLDREIEARLGEAQEAERMYRGEQPKLEVKGTAVVIVDDGIATGSTMEAGALSLRNRGARTVTAATPVGSRAACESLRRVADDVLCLTSPATFWAVGQFYIQFPQVSDNEVRRLLDESRSARATRNSR